MSMYKQSLVFQTKKELYFYELVVKRLIMQFKEYEHLNLLIKDIENKKFIYKLKKNYKLTEAIDYKLNLLKLDQQRISDEMIFANPVVWMMYKYEAYKNTNNEIKTVEDFVNHCSPVGYICTKRFKFVSKYLDIKNLFRLKDKLSKVYKSEALLKIVNNPNFMKSWKENEYLIKDNKISKWQNS